MQTKVKIVLHTALLNALTKLSYTAGQMPNNKPHDKMVCMLVSKLHHKFYDKLSGHRHTKASAEIKMTIKYEEAYALDVFIACNHFDNLNISEQHFIDAFQLKLNQALQ